MRTLGPKSRKSNSSSTAHANSSKTLNGSESLGINGKDRDRRVIELQLCEIRDQPLLPVGAFLVLSATIVQVAIGITLLISSALVSSTLFNTLASGSTLLSGRTLLSSRALAGSSTISIIGPLALIPVPVGATDIDARPRTSDMRARIYTPTSNTNACPNA